MKRMEGEKSEKHSNLLLASFEQVWKDNNQSDWYFFAEDDTVIFKDNLLRLVQQLNPNNDIFMGKCVSVYATRQGFGKILFVVGGGGILMSRTLLRKMLPNVADCRSKYTAVKYGDARVGACVNASLNRPWGYMESCPSRGFSFSNGELSQELTKQPPDNLIISLHIKDPTLLRRVNKAALDMGMGLTWRELSRYMNTTIMS
jgi:hypothetical protein